MLPFPKNAALLALLALSMVVVGGCDQQTPQPEAPVNAARAVMAVPDTGWVATPAGWYHRSCVHEIPNRAHLDAKGIVTLPDGRTFRLPPCLYPHYSSRPEGLNSNRAAPPTDNHWIEWAEYQLPAGDSYTQLTASWQVPQAPSGSYTGTQVYYTFPGLENRDVQESYIIQPVIQFGYNGYFGGSYWTAASWDCDTLCAHGTPITVASGHSISGSVTPSACINGTCTWTITVTDVTQNTRSDWTFDYTQDFNWATGGAVEVYGLNTCDQFPINGVFYSGISLDDLNGGVSPAWSTYLQSGLNPACNFQQTATATSVSLYHNRPPSASISGPTDITQAGTYTWTANPSGGIGGYSYAWQYRDAFNPNWVGAGGLQSVSKSVSPSTASWFDYQVVVTSGDQSSGQVSVHVINELGVCNPYCSPTP